MAAPPLVTAATALDTGLRRYDGISNPVVPANAGTQGTPLAITHASVVSTASRDTLHPMRDSVTMTADRSGGMQQ